MSLKRYQLSIGAALHLSAASVAQAADLLDYVIQAYDPGLAPARPLIECLAGGGDPDICVIEAAKKQAVGAFPCGFVAFSSVGGYGDRSRC